MELTIKPTLKQHLVYEALKNPVIDYIFFGGGAGGAKSWVLCESRLINAIQYPGYRSFIGRKELKRLMQSTFITWNKVCAWHKIPQNIWKLNGQYNYIEFTNGSRIDLLDVDYIPSDPLYERFGSLEYTDGSLEEAGEIHYLAFDVLKTRIGRHKNQEFGLKPTMLITGNPKKNWTYNEFYKPWKEGKLPENMDFIQALYMDNPYTAEEYGKQLSQIKDRATKERLMYGNWDYDDDPTVLMSFDAISDLFTNTVSKSEEKYLVCDVARQGGDKITISYWEGYDAKELYEYQYQGLDITETKLKTLANEKQVPYSNICVDEDGMGGGLVDNMKGIRGFINNSSPIETETINPINYQKPNYRNLKSQCAFILSEKVNNHKIAINCQDESIKKRMSEELAVIKQKDADKEGKLQINSKEEVKELLGRSPDWSDNLLMRMIFELKLPKTEFKVQSYTPKFREFGK